MIEELLKERLKVERDIFPIHEPFFNRFGDFGLCFLGLLFFPIRLVRHFAVPGSGEQSVPCI